MLGETSEPRGTAAHCSLAGRRFNMISLTRVKRDSVVELLCQDVIWIIPALEMRAHSRALMWACIFRPLVSG